MTTEAQTRTPPSARTGAGDGPGGARAGGDTPESLGADSGPQSLGAALLEFHRQVPRLRKDETAEVPTKSGGKYSYSYLTLDTLMDAVRPVLNEVGLVLAQEPTYVEGANGAPVPALTTSLFHPASNEGRASTMLLLAAQTDPQGQGSALTYARRYAIMAVLGLAAGDDDDAQAAQAATTQEKERREQEAREVAKARNRRDKITELVIALDKETKSPTGTWHKLVEQESLRAFGVEYGELKIEDLDEVGKTLKAKLDAKPTAVPEQLEFVVPFS